jgi:hypothetical protein
MMTVKAKVAGTKVPRQDNSRRYIGDEPLTVPRSSYYIRRVRDGELVELGEAEAKQAQAAAADKLAKQKAAEEKAAKTAAAADKPADANTKGKE